MAKADRWSLTDAQLERRKQNPAARKATAKRGKLVRGKSQNPAARKATAQRVKSDPLPFDHQWAMKTSATVDAERNRRAARLQAVSRPSPARLRERSSGSGVPHTGGAAGYSRDTYSKPDLASLEPGKLLAHRGETRHIQTPEGRGGWGSSPELEHTVPRREAYRASTRSGEGTRAASTEATFRAADASMYNSTVTPKAKRVEDKPSWSRRSPDQNVFW